MSKDNTEKLTSFLKCAHISPEAFEATGLIWENLLEIKKDYKTFKEELAAPGNALFETFNSIQNVHSIRLRLKDPNRLIKKIIRKKIENPKRIIDINSYKNEITDLIGIRALHSFKEDWLAIHRFITKHCTLKEKPVAYYCNGDAPERIEMYKTHGCEVKEHPCGYRSVHYLVETNMDKSIYISEVQVRTIFEEGWSEIDHKIRYTFGNENNLLNQFLIMFNRLSGNADEMGSYVLALKKELDKKDNKKL